ncbi:MAG TPA: amidase [Alphaproteobacteria bacterium]|jgi:Asp-tRNA(Asn)/Glu-tRNA(Gln) amidotransferase A subunit family amidase
MDDLHLLTASEAARLIREGRVTSKELVEACLAQIDAHEPEVQAWHYLDRRYALEQAETADAAHKAGKPHGPLHGVPVGVKDVFDTRDMPTENGCALHAGRTPRHDAAAVALLREAGAIILGKTVTAELAYYTPGKTRNPHDPQRTPGGSSSGSAAAVAAGMVPLALGTQTNGSTIRPASFCGVYGYKPTHGLVSRRHCLRLSRTLDHVGLFARTLEDIAIAGEALMRFDEEDPDTRPAAPPPLVRVLAEEPPVEPKLAFVETPAWDQAEAVAKDAFAELAEVLGAKAEPVALPEFFAEAWPAQKTIMEADMAHNLRREFERGREKLSPATQQAIERGRAITAKDYLAALALARDLAAEIEDITFAYDAILTPAAPGPAPVGQATGNPAFSTLWTLTGVPAVSLPLLADANGLPMGVQLVSRRGDDARLLRTARWLVSALS